MGEILGKRGTDKDYPLTCLPVLICLSLHQYSQEDGSFYWQVQHAYFDDSDWCGVRPAIGNHDQPDASVNEEILLFPVHKSRLDAIPYCLHLVSSQCHKWRVHALVLVPEEHAVQLLLMQPMICPLVWTFYFGQLSYRAREGQQTVCDKHDFHEQLE